MLSVGKVDANAACVGTRLRRLNSFVIQTRRALAARPRNGDKRRLVGLGGSEPSMATAKPRATPAKTQKVAVPPLTTAHRVKGRWTAMGTTAAAINAAANTK